MRKHASPQERPQARVRKSQTARAGGSGGTLFTRAARRHAALLADAIAPHARRIEGGCRALLKRLGYGPVVRRAFLAITPVTVERLRSLPRFVEEVEYQGRRLAKHNLPPSEVYSVLHEMEALLDPLLGERFVPSREQLHLATILALDRAFYQVREAEVQVLFGIYRSEAEAKTEEELLERLLATLTRAFRAGSGRLLVGTDLDPRLSRALFIRRGTPRTRLIADPKMRRRYVSYWSYPLADGVAMQLGFRVFYPWLPRERTLLELAAERCRGALRRMRLEAETARLAAEVRHAEEMERGRIGRELHDETAQALLLLRLELEMLGRQAQGPLADQLHQAQARVESIVLELRRIIAALSPTVVERLGLAPALRHLVARFQKTHPAAVRLNIEGSWDAVPSPIQHAIYRTTQECLRNIAKHSQATAVNLSLRADDKKLRAAISDNGVGIRSAGEPANALSFGLAGLRERAALLGGMLVVQSPLGKGTKVVLELPRNAAMVKENVKNSRVAN